MKQVVIVGAGFGGLRAARTLAGKAIEVMLLDQYNYHLFHPLLYQVATAGVEQENVAYPVRAIFHKQRNVHFQMARVEAIDLESRRVMTSIGPMMYDYLIVSAGSTTNFFGLEGAARVAHTLKVMSDAVTLRNQILGAFERAAREPDPVERQALLTFVIVGAGPTGVEFAGALAELVIHALRKDYPEIHSAEVRILLVEALNAVLSTFSPDLQAYARKRLERLGIQVRLGQAVTAVDGHHIVLADGTEILAHTLFWAAGVKAAPLAESLAVAKARGGRIAVNPDLSLPAHPDVYVIGDMAYLEQEGQALPMLAPVAMQQGEYAARAILAHEAGRSIGPFRYHSRGQMAIIGRNAAVAHAYGVRLKGFLAWLTWLALHLYYLIGFRNRLVALVNWAYSYLLLDPKLRLITTPAHELPE